MDEIELFSINRLKSELGMRPKINAMPTAWWKNSHNKTKYPVYKISDCEKLPIKKQLSASQVRAIKMLQINNALNRFDKGYRDMMKISEEVNKLFFDGFIVLDTETTGLDSYSQIIELSIIDHNGKVLHNSRYKPTVNISENAYRVHGISADMLKHEKDISVDEIKVRNILLNNKVVIFNSDYDIRLLKQTLKAFELDTDYIDSVASYCAMYASASCYGATNCYGTISLANAFYKAGGNSDDWQAHSALSDCKATLFVLNDIKSKQAFINSQKDILRNKLMEKNGLFFQ